MKKQLDMEKLIQEVMGFSEDGKHIKIDEAAMELLDAKQQQLEMIRRHLRGDLAKEYAEPQVMELEEEVKQAKAELSQKSYWWMEKV
jgi:hypothetical protein